jgi:hypothetical protein
MIRIALAGLLPTLAAPAPAWSDTALGCFVRVYDRSHLARHADQIVTAAVEGKPAPMELLKEVAPRNATDASTISLEGELPVFPRSTSLATSHGRDSPNRRRRRAGP